MFTPWDVTETDRPETVKQFLAPIMLRSHNKDQPLRLLINLLVILQPAISVIQQLLGNAM